MLGRIIACHALGKIGNHGMFSLIRPAKVEGHGERAAHIHHSQGGKLLQLLSQGTARRRRLERVRGGEEEEVEKENQRAGSARRRRRGGGGRGGCGGGREGDERGGEG